LLPLSRRLLMMICPCRGCCYFCSWSGRLCSCW
jgi:hypothetical protein